MEQSNSVREMLEQLSTEQLEGLLDKELHSETVDCNAIRMILGILRKRDKDRPVDMTPAMEKAWEKYQRDSAKIWEESASTRRIRNLALKIVSTAAVLVILLVSVVPKQAGAESLWETLVRWTADFVEFLSPHDNEGRISEYKFTTDNPGLQEVYDAVVELGVTEPVVPMWLPEIGEAIECKTVITPACSSLRAKLPYNDGEITYRLDVFQTDVSHEYYKDETQIREYVVNKTTFNIMRNNDVWIVVWLKENIECSIGIDCQEETLYRILKSIYVMEDE